MFNPYYNNYGGFQPQNNQGMQMPPQRQYNTMPRFKVYPVSSYDEVKSAILDYDGSINIFTDFANGHIYIKEIGNDGRPLVTVFTKEQAPKIVDPLEQRVNQLEIAIKEMRGARNEFRSNGADGRASHPNDANTSELAEPDGSAAANEWYES